MISFQFVQNETRLTYFSLKKKQIVKLTYRDSIVLHCREFFVNNTLSLHVELSLKYFFKSIKGSLLNFDGIPLMLTPIDK